MKLPSVPTRAMAEHLNDAYFHKVWNAPDDHGRANFPLQKVAQRLQIGTVPVDLSVVGLPTTDQVYAVYRSSPRVFGRFATLPKNIWFTDQDLLHSDFVQIMTYAKTGRVIPAGKVYFRYDPIRSMVLIAIGQKYTSKCIGQSYPDLFMTVDYDTSSKTPVVVNSWVVTSLNGSGSAPIISQAVTAQYQQYASGSMIFVNGWCYDYTNLPSLVKGDVISIVSDPDIVGYCDLMIDDNFTGYYSDFYHEYREILHIPKVLNNTNVVITNDTIAMVIFDTESKRGVYGHRIDPHALESITHNDFSVSRQLLQAFQNGLGAQSVFVRLLVRLPTNPISLGREVNQIKDLYSLNDQDIKNQLIGVSPFQIKEWKASHLEASSYLDLVYNFNGFSETELFNRYVKAMGYYDVASTLSEFIHHYTYHNGSVKINKPVRLIGCSVELLVYADGRKIPSSQVSMFNECNHSFMLGFKQGAYITNGSRITVCILEGGNRTPVIFSPTENNSSVVMKHEDYDLVEITSYADYQPVWKDSVVNGFKAIPISPGDYKVTVNSDGTATFTFDSNHYGKSFYLFPIGALATYQREIDFLLITKSSLVIPLEMTDADGNSIPLVGARQVEIYINGYRLISDIDYRINPIIGSNNDVLQTLLTISNTEYIDFGKAGNMLEVVVHGDSMISSDHGYVIDNLLHRDSPPMIWSSICGRAFARGRLIEKVTEEGDTLISSTDITDGSPYLTEWLLPYGVVKLLKNISSVPDTNLKTRITGVLGLNKPVYPELVIVSDLYSLYSPYLATIIKDVALGDFTIVDEPQDTLFLKQFSAYKLLYPRDLVVDRSNHSLDRRFVTLAAHYANFPTYDQEQMLLVQRLISLVLTPSELALDEVLI